MSPDEGGGDLEPERLHALLLRAYPSLTREQWLDLDDWTLINVYLRPNRNKKPEEGYWPETRFDPDDPPVGEITVRQLFFLPKRVEYMRSQGMDDAAMEAEFKKWSKSYDGGQD